MSGKQVSFNPLQSADPNVTYQITEKNMAFLFTVIEESVRKVVQEEMSLATEKPMNVADVAEFLQLCEATVRLKTRQGIIPSVELEPGGQKFYYASQINAKMKEGK